MTVVQARVFGGQDLGAGVEMEGSEWIREYFEGEDDGPSRFGGLGIEPWDGSPGEGQHQRGELSCSVWQPPRSGAYGNEASVSREMHF